MKNSTNKKSVLTALTITLVFILCMLCSCGGSGSSEGGATEAETKATVTAGEAADQAKEATTQKKTGTEDPAIDAAKAKATKDIKGFDGNWENLSIDVDDPITIIEFDWKGKHYQYTFDQESGKITE